MLFGVHNQVIIKATEHRVKKTVLLGTLLVAIIWSLLDFVIHGYLLKDVYFETAYLWRPVEEMKSGIMQTVIVVGALFYTLLYQRFYGTHNSLKSGVQFGFYLGMLWGVSAGLGTYSFQDIPLFLACAWLFAVLIKSVAAGVGLHWAFRKWS